jgi:hypothetical protein
LALWHGSVSTLPVPDGRAWARVLGVGQSNPQIDQGHSLTQSAADRDADRYSHAETAQ